MKNLSADYARYRALHSPLGIATSFGFWAIVDYRFGHWARTAAPVPARPVLRVVSAIVHKLVQIATGIGIDPNARIGPGMHIGHFSCIFINGDAVIGAQFGIDQGVTIGNDARGGVPVIGDRVSIYPGAKVIGAVTIGDDAKVGVNAVVLSDVPAGATAVGVPARMIPPTARAES